VDRHPSRGEIRRCEEGEAAEDGRQREEFLGNAGPPEAVLHHEQRGAPVKCGCVGGDRRPGVLSLGGEDRQVGCDRKSLACGHLGQMLSPGAVEGESMGPDGLELRSSGGDDDLVASPIEQRRKGSADGSRPDHRDPHALTLRLAW